MEIQLALVTGSEAKRNVAPGVGPPSPGQRRAVRMGSPARVFGVADVAEKLLLVYVDNAREEPSVLSATACVQPGSTLIEKMTMAASAWHAVLLGVSLIPAERIWSSINKADSSGRVSKMFVMQDVLRISRQVMNCLR